MGLRPHQMRVLPTDDHWRLRPGTVTAAARADRGAGLVPFAVCASAGSTNTGAVHPLAALADVCAADGLWLHVDAAYGGVRRAHPAGPGAAGRDRASRLGDRRPARMAAPAARLRRRATPRRRPAYLLRYRRIRADSADAIWFAHHAQIIRYSAVRFYPLTDRALFPARGCRTPSAQFGAAAARIRVGVAGTVGTPLSGTRA